MAAAPVEPISSVARSFLAPLAGVRRAIAAARANPVFALALLQRALVAAVVKPMAWLALPVLTPFKAVLRAIDTGRITAVKAPTLVWPALT